MTSVGNLSTKTVTVAVATTGIWSFLLLLFPQIALSPRVAVTLNTLSAFLFVLYLEEDPDLTSTKRYVVSRFLPDVSGRTVGAVFISLMLVMYVWLSWSLSGKFT